MGHDTSQSSKSQSIFWKNVLHSALSKASQASNQQQETATEKAGNTFPRIKGKLLPNYKASYLKRMLVTALRIAKVGCLIAARIYQWARNSLFCQHFNICNMNSMQHYKMFLFSKLNPLSQRNYFCYTFCFTRIMHRT